MLIKNYKYTKSQTALENGTQIWKQHKISKCLVYIIILG